MLRLIERVHKAGLKPKPELSVQFGAGGGTSAEELKAEGVSDVGWLIAKARRLIEAGVELLTIESEGVTGDVAEWRTDIPARIIAELGLECVMFEAADPRVFEWYVKSYGNEVNLFVDHSQVLQLEALRQGIWGTMSTWGRIHNL